MIIDSSAIIALLLGEVEAERIAQAMANDPRRLICAFSLLEMAIVIEAKKGDVGGRELDLLIHQIQADVIPLDEDQGNMAREAWKKYGKGRHPASLNIGDCCAYALAKVSGEPLLYVGNDFGQTDIAAVIY